MTDYSPSRQRDVRCVIDKLIIPNKLTGALQGSVILILVEVSTGPGRMRAGPGRAGPGRAGPNLSGPGRAGPNDFIIC